MPIGLKRTPSYFQRILATVVLVGLIYTICLVYIDDVCVYAQTEEEFLSRLEKDFGRVINEHGISMPPDKKKKVVNFRILQMVRN